MQDLPPSQAVHDILCPHVRHHSAVTGGNCLPGTPFAALAPAALAGRVETASRKAVSSKNKLVPFFF